MPRHLALSALLSLSAMSPACLGAVTSESARDGELAADEDGEFFDPDEDEALPPTDDDPPDDTDEDPTPPGDDDGPVGCANTDYLLCEDFESADDGVLPTGWSVHYGWNSGDVGVTSAEARSGTKSLASAVAVNGQPRAAHSLTGLGSARGKHWGRVFYKVRTPYPLPASNTVIHNTLVGLVGTTEARVVDTVVNSAGKHQFLYNLPDDSCCTGSAYNYSYDGGWHCAEWWIDADTQSFKFFYNGTEVPGVSFANRSDGKAKLQEFSSVVLGWINYQSPASPYYLAWFDDLALSTSRIGCD